MALQISDTEPRIQYTATSGQTAFAVPFEFFDVADLKVYNGTTLLTYNNSPSSASQYSVTGAGVTGGGSITLGGSGATLNDVITISRDVTIERTSDFPVSGNFPIQTLNTELDKIIAMCQQLNRDLKFSPRAADTTANTFDITFPNLAANKVLSVNSAGTGLEFAQDITDITTIAGIASDVTTVSGIAGNVTTVANNNANVTTVASNISNVNTVALNISDIVTVANDLNEAISEIETVASDLQEASPEIDTVAGSISNVDSVGANIASVTTVAGSISNVNTVAGNNTNISTVAGISGNVTTVAGISANVSTVAGISSDVSTVAGDTSYIQSVAGISSDVAVVAGDTLDIQALADIQDGTTATNAITTVAGIASNVTTVATDSANITTVAGISSEIGTVAGISNNVQTVAGISSDVTSVAADATDIGTVASNISNVNSVAGSITNVNTVATNISGINDFADRYRVSATAPTTSLDAGDLYFDTATDTMKVYGSSGWQNAGSSVNGTSQRYNYTATSGQTTFTGLDNNGNTLTYDAGYIDVYLNGVKLLNGTDVTVTSGTSVVLASGASTGDIIDIVAYGTFSVASLNADNLDSGTVPDARLSGSYTGITEVGTLTGLTTTGDINLGDNDKARFGTTPTLELYSDGSNSWIKESGAGGLYIGGTNLNIMDSTFAESIITGTTNGAVTLYYDNSAKLATTSSGINVTGTAIGLGNSFASSNPTGGAFSFTDPDSATIQTVARIGNDSLTAGTLVSELEIMSYGSGNDSGGGSIRFINSRFSSETGLIKSAREGFNTGYLDFYTQSSGIKKRMRIASGGDISFYEDTGTTPKFYWDASAESLDIGGGASNAILDVVGSVANDWALRAENNEGTGQGWGGLIVASANTSSEKAFEVRKNTSDTALLIDGVGNVGIGTSSPNTNLEVFDSSNSRILISTSDTSTGASQVYFGDTDSDLIGRIYYDHAGNSMRFHTNGSEAIRIDSSGQIGIGTSSPTHELTVSKSATGISDNPTFQIINTWTGEGNNVGFSNRALTLLEAGNGTVKTFIQSRYDSGANLGEIGTSTSHDFRFLTGNSEAMRIDSSGNLMVNKTTSSRTTNGIELRAGGTDDAHIIATNERAAGGAPIEINRQVSDGTLIAFYQADSAEGSITVSGTTVSYNGGHLSRWSQLLDNTRDNTILKGTVMSNLDEMCVWGDEDNEQLNKMKVSDTEGDDNVAGVFVNWDNDDVYTNDMNIAMTGDMVIRIAQGVPVHKGQLLMSAGDGTAKPQGDDIVRSKTIAKVTSNNVTKTYDDGSYLVPCVLMAC